jgi:hypothetical protein
MISEEADSVIEGKLVLMYSAKACSEWCMEGGGVVSVAASETLDGTKSSETSVSGGAHEGGNVTRGGNATSAFARQRALLSAQTSLNIGLSLNSGAASAKEKVRLNYRAVDAKGTREMFHDSPELLDFQSNLVLAKSIENAVSSVKTTIDRFLFQFSWMRRLATALYSLHQAGHFAYYPSYRVTLSTACKDDEIKTFVLACERELATWESAVLAIRQRSHFINYFDIKRCFTLIKELEECVQQGPFDNHRNESRGTFLFEEGLAEYICTVNVDIARDSVIVQRISTILLNKWRSDEEAHVVTGVVDDTGAQPTISDCSAATTCAVNKLSRLAVALDDSLMSVPMRQRWISIPNIEDKISIGAISGGK